MSLVTTITNRGFALAQQILNPHELQAWIQATEILVKDSHKTYGIRNILQKSEELKTYITSPQLTELVHSILGNNAQPVRTIYFDKSPQANWYVTWHQDVTICVKEKYIVSGYTAWSFKEDVHHVQPPTEILENMLTLRVHLDDATEQNGALEVIEGSHRYGKLSRPQIDEILNNSPTTLCQCRAGDTILMKPLILHASKKGTTPTHRRIVHIEYSALSLPAPLEWYDA